MSDQEAPYYERRLMQEIEAIEGRIRELERDKAALQRLLLRARRENAATKEVGRKNSIDRVLIESKIVETLEQSDRVLSTRQLYRETSSVVFPLNENTFRSHLHRLKKRGRIHNPRGERGMWRLSE